MDWLDCWSLQGSIIQNLLTKEKTAATLSEVFGVRADDAAWIDSGSGFPDWEVIAHALVQVARARDVAVVGICGSQGSGKSTLAEVCVDHFHAAGVTAAAVSIDDFYLTQAARLELGKTVHPLLATRGVPGTHDTQWLGAVLRGERKDAPVFDKGLDDRSGERLLEADVLILEGWCVGVHPETEDRLREPCNDLEQLEDPDGQWRGWVNAQIGERYDALWNDVDFWIRLKPPSFEQVFQWRLQQEQQLPAERRMDAAGIQRFIQHYERLTLWQWACPAPAPGLDVELAADHTAADLRASNG